MRAGQMLWGLTCFLSVNVAGHRFGTRGPEVCLGVMALCSQSTPLLPQSVPPPPCLHHLSAQRSQGLCLVGLRGEFHDHLQQKESRICCLWELVVLHGELHGKGPREWHLQPF